MSAVPPSIDLGGRQNSPRRGGQDPRKIGVGNVETRRLKDQDALEGVEGINMKGAHHSASLPSPNPDAPEFPFARGG